ncbi:hypothetical protein Hanom_Chr15g01342931 [Helianthus anomalus]
MKLLPCLQDPHCELLLLRSCIGVAKLLFGLRTCQPHLMANAVSCFDDGLREAIEDIVVCGGSYFGDLQWRLASLPMRLGGLGLLSARDVGVYAFVASRAQSCVLQDHILRNSGVAKLDPDYQQALEYLTESKKVDKHAKACADNQHAFVPFAFDTFGSLAPEVVRLLTRVQKVVRSSCSSTGGHGFVFNRLGFAIQKGVAAQLVARLPTILM